MVAWLTDSAVVNEPDELTATAILEPTSCSGANIGFVDISVSGGTVPYNFIWNNGATTEDLLNLAEGIYSVTISDANSCLDTQEYFVPGTGDLSLENEIIPVSCNGETDGEINITIVGGMPPLEFQWSNGATTGDITGLGPGTYFITATDASGCSIIDSFIVQEPPPLDLIFTNILHPTMPGEKGEATVQIIGGISPYTIQWGNGETGTTATQLDTGITIISVQDANGCILEDSVEIQLAFFNVQVHLASNSCFNDCEGEIALTIVGGTPPFAFEWSDGSTSMDRSGLCNGVYSVTVTDSGGSTNIVDLLEIESPPEFILSADATGISCVGEEDGSIFLEMYGGVRPYNYLWSDGSIDSSRLAIGPGPYSLTVTDANGCILDSSFIVGDVVTVDLQITETNIDCNNEMGSILIEGNTEQYNIYLNGYLEGNTSSILVEDLFPGSYNVEYEINPGCIISIDVADILVTSDFNLGIEPAFVELIPGAETQFALNITGTIGNYLVEWNTVSGYTCLSEDSLGNCPVIAISPDADQTILLTVTDEIWLFADSGCKNSY